MLVAAALAVVLVAQEEQEQRKDEKPTPAAEPGKDIKIDDHHEAQKKTEDLGAPAPARAEMEPASEPPKKEDESDPDEKKFTIGAYVETFYQYNFNKPGNGISNYRGYDNRHNTLTIANAVLDFGFRAKNLLARLAVQFGHTAASLYQQETDLGGSDGAAATNPQLWQYLQRASVGWQATRAFLFEAGLFLTNTGVESFAVKDNWNWSRTSAITRLPNYQTGLKTTWHAGDRLDLIAGVVTGWNTVVDNNDEKSFILQGQYKLKEWLSASAAYYGGVERRGGAPEGRAWRHAFDAYIQTKHGERVELAAEGSGGWEHNRFGLHWFAGTAGYARFKILEWLYVAARADALWEDPSANRRGAATPVRLPAKRIFSTTATLDFRPVKGLSLRIEGKRDMATSELFFRSSVAGNGKDVPYVTNARTQTTLLGGVVAWF